MKNCTVVIATHNRTVCLRRILDYFKANGIGLEFIVIDSSSTEDQISNQKTVDFYNNQEGVKFTRYSYAESISPWIEFADGVSKVKTEYCVLCADDDFIVPQGIEEAVNFLDANPDFTVAHGKYISFYLNKGDANIPKFCWQLTYPHQSNISPDPVKRVVQNLGNYFPTMYAVHRTGIAVKAFRDCANPEINTALFSELLSSIFSLLYGKMKVLDIFYCARQEGSVCSTTQRIKRQTITDYVDISRFEPEYQKFKKYLVNQIRQINGVDEAVAARAIDAAMKEYIVTSYPPILDYYRYKASATLVSFFKKISLPNILYRSMSFVYRLFFPISTSKSNHDFSGTALARCQNDLDAIRDKVISFGKI